MHPTATMKQWAHEMHDDLLRFEHAVGEHLRSRHFWIGVFAAVLVIGVLTLLMFWAVRGGSPGSIDGFDYMYPYMYYRV